MQDKESSLPEDWFRKGDDDKQVVGILLEHGGMSSVAAFLIQQMLEKYMKGFLLFTFSRGIRFLGENSAGKRLRMHIMTL